jgi:VCBS repeat-containing protein
VTGVTLAAAAGLIGVTAPAAWAAAPSLTCSTNISVLNTGYAPGGKLPGNGSTTDSSWTISGEVAVNHNQQTGIYLPTGAAATWTAAPVWNNSGVWATSSTAEWVSVKNAAGGYSVTYPWEDIWFRIDFTIDSSVTHLSNISLPGNLWADDAIMGIWINGVLQTVPGIPSATDGPAVGATPGILGYFTGGAGYGPALSTWGWNASDPNATNDTAMPYHNVSYSQAAGVSTTIPGTSLVTGANTMIIMVKSTWSFTGLLAQLTSKTFCPIPSTVADSATTPVSTPVTVTVLPNDSDGEGGGNVTLTLVTNGTHGTAAVNGSQVTYTPTAGYVGTDQVTYTIRNAYGATATGTVTITMSPPLPDAVNDTALTTPGTAVNITVLGNDTGDAPLTVTSKTNGTNGTVVINGDGTVTYTPTVATWTGTDTFTYTITDPYSQTDTATVTVTVQPTTPAPDAVNDSTTTTPGTAVIIPVLTNDTGDAPLTVTAKTDGANGTVVINANGTVTYTPTVATWTGTDTFTYTLSDRYGRTDTATVTVTVSPAPDAINDSTVTAPGTPVSITVLSNDTGDAPLTVTGKTNGTNGTVAINGDGTVTYTPTVATWTGTDMFTYTITDPHGRTDTATVTVTVSPVPDAVDDVESLPPGNPDVTITVLSNDTGDGPLVVTAKTDGTYGTVVINSDGTVTYTPSSLAWSTDTFTYTITDVHGRTDTATVKVTNIAFLNANKAPVPALDAGALGALAVLLAATGWRRRKRV